LLEEAGSQCAGINRSEAGRCATPWRTTNLDTQTAELKAEGVKLLSDPKASGTVRVAFVEGPAAVKIEVIQCERSLEWRRPRPRDFKTRGKRKRAVRTISEIENTPKGNGWRQPVVYYSALERP
jgi:hypothetical protein